MITLAKKKTVDTDDQRVTALAAAVYIARCAYNSALRRPNPAAALDEMCDEMASIWAEILPKLPEKLAGADLEFAETMRAAVADRLWAFAVVEHTRVEAGDGYGYVFDLLADQLRAGADPHSIRTTAFGIPGKVRAFDTQAGDAA